MARHGLRYEILSIIFSHFLRELLFKAELTIDKFSYGIKLRPSSLKEKKKEKIGDQEFNQCTYELIHPITALIASK